MINPELFLPHSFSMRWLLLLALLLPFDAAALGIGRGGSVPPACTASGPTQATTPGLNTLAFCNTFSNNQAVDIYTTQNPGYQFYNCETDTTYPCAGSSFYTNDGTGISIQSNVANQNPVPYDLLTVGRKATAPYWQGTPLKGKSFYVEVDQKFSRNRPTSDNTWPALWGGEGLYSLNGTFTANWPFMEIDFLECLPQGVGQACNFNQQIHIWQNVAGVGTLECSFGGNYSTTPPANTNIYHTYGMRFLMPADNAGVIEVDYYVDNTLTNACTQTDGTSVVSCTYNGGHTIGTNGGYSPTGPNCTSGYDMSVMKTTDFTFIMGGAYQWPVTLRNFHVWTK